VAEWLGDLDKYTIPECTQWNTVYSDNWDTSYFSGAIVSDPVGDVYVINSTRYLWSHTFVVWQVRGSSTGIETKFVANITVPHAGFSAPYKAVWMPDFYAQGHDAMALIVISEQTFLVVDVQSWEITQRLNEPNVAWPLGGGAVYYQGILFFGSAVGNSSEFNGTLNSYNFVTGDRQQIFICTPEMRQICAPRSLVIDSESLTVYFATGWQIWSFPLQNPTNVTPVLDMTPAGNVNGVFGGAWFYNNTYWYGDSVHNINYVTLSSPPKAFSTNDNLGRDGVILNGLIV